jgi:hypothetical protein
MYCQYENETYLALSVSCLTRLHPVLKKCFDERIYAKGKILWEPFLVFKSRQVERPKAWMARAASAL